MTERPDLFSASEPGPSAGPAPPEHGGSKVFRSERLPFVLLRVALYVLLYTAIGYALSFAYRSLLPNLSELSYAGLLVQELFAFFAAFAPALLFAKFEHRPSGDYGLPLRSAFGRHFWQGALLGLAEISAVIGLIAALGGYRFGSLALHGAVLMRWGLLWGLFFLVVGFSEEFSYRGYVQFTLSKGIGFWPAAILLSAIFGAVHLHNPGENWVGALGVFVTGLFWCLTLRRTGSLWFAVGMHAAFDFGETFLFSVPNSGYLFEGHLSNATLRGPAWLTGGAVGPEGSVFDFLLLGVFFYLFHRWYPRKQAAAPATQ